MKRFLLTFLMTALSIGAVLAQPRPNTIPVGDGSLGNALFMQTALDSNGNPLIGYWDSGDKALELARCQDPICDMPAEIISFPNTTEAAVLHTVLLDPEERPLLLYTIRELGVGDQLKLVGCMTIDCTELFETTIHDMGLSIAGDAAFNEAGQLYIVYNAPDADEYRLAICDEVTCTNPSIRRIFGSIAVSPAIDLVFSPEGNPIIAHERAISTEITIAYCSNPLCTDGSIATIHSGVGTIDGAEMAIDRAGNPVLAYYSLADGGVMLATCSDPGCSDVSQLFLADVTTTSDISLVLDSEDRPRIAYIDSNPGQTWLITCVDTACQERETTGFGLNAQFLSMHMRENDTPLVVIGSMVSGNRGIKVFDCTDPACN